MITLLISAAFAICPTVTLPSSFSVAEETLSWTTTFDVAPNGGTVSGDMWSWTPSFTYSDPQGHLIATAKKASLPWGVRVDVYDCDNALIGSIQEKIFALTLQTVYAILDPQGKEIATSAKFEWLSTTFAINDPAGQSVASLTRPMHPFGFGGDTWNVQVAKPNVVDNRILVMTAAFKTEADSHQK